MINIYYNTKNHGFYRTIEWLEYHRISYNIKPILQLTREDFLKILSLTDNGFEDLFSVRKVHKQAFDIYTMNQLIDYILENPKILKAPIAFNEKHLLIGYDAGEIRVFLSRNHRKEELKLTKNRIKFENT